MDTLECYHKENLQFAADVPDSERTGGHAVAHVEVACMNVAVASRLDGIGTDVNGGSIIHEDGGRAGDVMRYDSDKPSHKDSDSDSLV